MIEPGADGGRASEGGNQSERPRFSWVDVLDYPGSRAVAPFLQLVVQVLIND